MSWIPSSLNEGFNNIKGQIVTLTKEVLNDEYDEPNSRGTTLQNEAVSVELPQKLEIEEQTRIRDELEERLRDTELQSFKRISFLEEKLKSTEAELISLKSKSKEWNWDDQTNSSSDQESLRLKLQETINAHQSELASVQNSHKAELSELREELEKLKDERNSNSNNTVDNTQNEIKENKEIISNLRDQVANLQKECDILKEDKNKLNDDVQQLDMQHQSALDVLFEKKSQLSDELNSAKERIEILEKELSQAKPEDALANLMHKNKILITEMKEISEKQDSSIFSTDFDELKIKEGVILQLQVQLEKANMQIESQKLENIQLTANINPLEEEVKKLKNDMDLALAERDKAILSKERLQVENSQSVKYLRDKLDACEEKVLQYAALLEERENGQKACFVQHQKDQQVISSLNDQVKLFKKQVLEMNETYPNVNSRLSPTVLEYLQKLITEYSITSLEELPSALEEKNSELASLRCERDKLHEDLRESQELNDAIETEKIDLERECEDLRDQLEELQFGERQQPEGSVRGLPTIEEEDEESVDWRQKASRLQLQVTTLLETCQSLKQQLEDKRETPRGSPEKEITRDKKERIGSIGSQDSFDQNEKNVESIDLVEKDKKIRKLEVEISAMQNIINRDASKEKDLKICDLESELISVQKALDKEKSLSIFRADQIDELKDGIRLIGELVEVEEFNLQETFVRVKKHLESVDGVSNTQESEDPPHNNKPIVQKIAFKAVQDDIAIQRLAKENELFKEKAKESEDVFESLSNKNIEFAVEIKKLNEEIIRKEEECTSQTKKICILETKLESCDQETEKLKCYYEKVFTEQTNSNSIKDREIMQIKSEIKSLKSENELKENNIKLCKEELKNLKNDLQLSLDENLAIKKIIENEKSSNDSKVCEYEGKISALNSEVLGISTKLSEASSENVVLKDELAKFRNVEEQHQQTMQLKNARILELESELSIAQSDCANIDAKKGEINEYIIKNEELKSKLILSEHNKVKLEEDKNNFLNSMEVKDAEIQKLSQDLDNMVLKERETNDKTLELDSKLVILENELEKEKLSNVEKNCKIIEMNKALNSLELKLDSFKDSKNKFENDDQKRISELQVKLNCLSEENNALNQKIDDYKNSLFILESKNNEARTTLNTNEEKLQNNEDKICQLSKEKTQLLDDFVKLKEEYSGNKLQIESLNDENIKLKLSIDSAQSNLLSANESNVKLESEVSELKGALDKLKGDFNCIKEKHDDLYSQCQTLQSEKQKLIETSTQKHMESISYYEQLQKMSLELLQVKEFAAKQQSSAEGSELKNEEINNLKEQVEIITKELNTSNENVSKLTNEVSKYEADIQSMKKKNEQLITANSSFNSQYESLSKELSTSQEREKYQKTEIARLKEHLLTVEESHTNEAVESKHRENTLKQTIAKLHDKMASHSTIYSSNNQKHADKVGTLEEQLKEANIAKEEAVQKLSASEEMSFQHQEGLKRLQQVLNDFQKSHSKEVFDATERERKKLKDEKDRNMELQNHINNLQRKLDDLEMAISTVKDMKTELQSKEDMIVALKSQVNAIQQAARKSQDQLQVVQTAFDGKIDKNLIRNLFVGYFATATDKRREVLHVIAQVLNFSSDERTRIGLDTHPGSWMTSVANFLAPPPSNIRVTSRVDVLDHTSLSQAFIRFLEDESTIRPVPKLPAVKMAEEVNEKSKRKQPTAQINVDAKEDQNISPLLNTSLAQSLSTFQPVVATDQVSEHKYLQNLLEPDKNEQKS